MGKRRCKMCGQPFESEYPKECYCSALCRTTGLFVGGGEDTSKPIPPDQRKKSRKPEEKPIPKEKRERRAAGEKPSKFPRVDHMFTLPIEERWAVASQFTAEEQAYSIKVQKRMLAEERRLDEILDWDGADLESTADGGSDLCGDVLGDSDDGTI